VPSAHCSGLLARGQIHGHRGRYLQNDLILKAKDVLQVTIVRFAHTWLARYCIDQLDVDPDRRLISVRSPPARIGPRAPRPPAGLSPLAFIVNVEFPGDDEEGMRF